MQTNLTAQWLTLEKYRWGSGTLCDITWGWTTYFRTHFVKSRTSKKRGAFSSLGSSLTGQGEKIFARYGTMWLKSILPDVDFPASPTPACPAKHIAVKVKVRQDTERLERYQFVLFTCPYRFHIQPRGTPPGHNLKVRRTDKSANFKWHLILLCTWMMSIVEGRLTRLLMFASIWISKTCKHEIKGTIK